MTSNNSNLYTIGHSTHPLDAFVHLLKRYDVGLVADVRTIPRSRHNPQFNGDTLPHGLAVHHVGYRHMKGLGGLRKAREDSVNKGWENLSFRGYADYMQTDEFAVALEELIEVARETITALMCAEALPWRCHRSLISDALMPRGVQAVHIMANGKSMPHSLTPFARIEGTRVTYPEAQGRLSE